MLLAKNPWHQLPWCACPAALAPPVAAGSAHRWQQQRSAVTHLQRGLLQVDSVADGGRLRQLLLWWGRRRLLLLLRPLGKGRRRDMRRRMVWLGGRRREASQELPVAHVRLLRAWWLQVQRHAARKVA